MSLRFAVLSALLVPFLQWVYLCGAVSSAAFLSYTLSRRSNSMKRCPKCHFSFADFHRVCAFDGSPLLDDSQRPPSSVKDRLPRTRFRRVPKLQLFPDGVAVVALLASALLIRYYHSPR